MNNERIVVVKEQKRGGFWPFVGGMLLGAAVLKGIEHLSEKKQNKNVEPEKTLEELSIEREIEMVESLIDDLVSKTNKSQKDLDNLKSLRIKLGQLRNQ
jgi:hypothetical protein